MKAHDDALQSIFSTLDNLTSLEELDSNEENYLNQWINEKKITDPVILKMVILAIEQKKITLPLQKKLRELNAVILNEEGEIREKWNREEDEIAADELTKMLEEIEILNKAYDALVDDIVEKTEFLEKEDFDELIEEIQSMSDYLNASKEVYESELIERQNAALLKDKINDFFSALADEPYNETDFLLTHEALKKEVENSELNAKTKTELIRILDVLPSYYLEKNIKDVEKSLKNLEDSTSRSVKKNIRELYNLSLISSEMKRQIKDDSNKQFLAERINQIEERIHTSYERLKSDIFKSKTFGKHMTNLSKLTGQLNMERIKIQQDSHLYRWGQKKRAIKKIEMLERKIEIQKTYLENMYPNYENSIASLASSNKKMKKYQAILLNNTAAVNASAQIYPDERGPAGLIYERLKTSAEYALTAYNGIASSWQPDHDISSLYQSYQTAIANVDKVLTMYADMEQDKKSFFARLKGGPIVRLLKAEPPYISNLKATRETLLNDFKEKALAAMTTEINHELSRAKAINDLAGGRDGVTIMYTSFLNNLAESVIQHANTDEIMRHYQSLKALKSNVNLEENIQQFKTLQIQDLTEKMQVINNTINEWKNRFPHQTLLNDTLSPLHKNLREELQELQNSSYLDESNTQQNLDRIGNEIKSVDTQLFSRMAGYVSSLANDEVEKIKLLSLNASEKNLKELSELQEQIEDSVNHVNHDNVVSVYKYLHKIEEEIEKLEGSMKADNLYYAKNLTEKQKNTLSAIDSLQSDFPAALVGKAGQQLDSIHVQLHQLHPMEIFNQNNLSYQQLKEEDERLQKLITQFQAVSGSIQLQSILDKETIFLKESLNDLAFSHSAAMTFNKHNLPAAYFLLNDVIGKKHLETGNESYLYAFIELTKAISERNFEKMNYVYADFLKALPDNENLHVKNLVEHAMMQNYHNLTRAQDLLETDRDFSLPQIQKIKKQNYDTILNGALNRLNVFISSLQHNEKVNMHYFLDFYDIDSQQMKSDYAWLFAHNKEFNVTFNRAFQLASQHKLLEFSRQRPVLTSLKELALDDKERPHHTGSPRFFASTIKPDLSTSDEIEHPKPKNK